MISQQRSSNLHLNDCVTAQKITIPFLNCEKCNHRMIDGLSKCENCCVPMEAWSDNRIAMEVCQLESRAAEKSGVFSIDQISTVQPRKHCMGSEARQGRRAGRTNFGVMKDGARKRRSRSSRRRDSCPSRSASRTTRSACSTAALPS